MDNHGSVSEPFPSSNNSVIQNYNSPVEPWVNNSASNAAESGGAPDPGVIVISDSDSCSSNRDINIRIADFDKESNFSGSEEDISSDSFEGVWCYPSQSDEPEPPKCVERRPDLWKRNVRKQKRASGESYVSNNGRVVPAASMKPDCGPNCRMKCGASFDESTRLAIFRSYYALSSYARQREFIISHTTRTVKAHTTVAASRRVFSIFYYLPVNGNNVKVCKTMFINTLGIGKGVVDVAMTKRTLHNTFASDKRGRKPRATTHPMPMFYEKQPAVPQPYKTFYANLPYSNSSLEYHEETDSDE